MTDKAAGATRPWHSASHPKKMNSWKPLFGSLVSRSRITLSGVYKTAVVVQGNPRVYKALRNELAAVLEQLQHIESGADIDEDLLDTIHMIAAIMDGMKAEY